MYYLQSRYYNPKWGRLISTDTVIGETGTLLSHNMFTYCLNNPVNMEDSDGEFAFFLVIPVAIKVAIGIGVAAGAIYTGYTVGAYARHGVEKSNIKSSTKSKGNSNEKAKSKDVPNAKAPASPGSLQNQVEKGQAPKDVDRVDKPHVPGQKPHVHFKDGTYLNNDGTIHDAHKGTPNPSNKTKEWLKKMDGERGDSGESIWISKR